MATAARWRPWEGDGLEHLVLRESLTGIVAESLVIAAEFAVRYRILCDAAWRTRGVEIAVLGDDRHLALIADGAGRWSDGAGGAPLPALDGALDVDLTCTPFTNTLPIRRLGLAPGVVAEIVVAYVRVPELTIAPEGQRYTCLEPGRRYRFDALDGGFTREIGVDEHALVTEYPGLFRRVS